MNDDQVQPEQPAARRRLGPVTALAVGSVAGHVLGIGGIASAQTAETPAPAPSTSVAPEAEAEEDAAQDELCDKEEAAAEEEAADSAA